VYSGRSLLVTDVGGWITGRGIEGFYVDNTRLIARDELFVGDHRLESFAATPVRGDGLLAYAEVPASAGVPERSVFVEMSRFVGDGLRTTIRVSNHAPKHIALNLAIRLAADFADQQEAHEGQRRQSAEVSTTWDQAKRELLFRYCHPRLDRAVAVRVEEGPDGVAFDTERLVVPIDLNAREERDIVLSVQPIFDGRRRDVAARTFAGADTQIERVRTQLRAETPELITTNTTVARAWQTATEDLASMALGLHEGAATPIAGLPLYQQFFGRDSLTTAWQALMAMPTMMRDTLRANAAWQGTVIDDWLDEEPGKMIHQARWGPLSLLDIDPFRRYYGDYATVPDFLIMLGQYLAWTSDRDTVRQLLPAARRALEWLERYADLDGDGFIEYLTRSSGGVKHQGWKDSGDAIVDHRGEQIEPPIATSELQAYWYAALGQAAVCFLACGDAGKAIELRREAQALKRRFNERFWMEDEGFYAMALGPDKKLIRSISSNTGHLLAAGIVPRDRAERVVRRLMEPDLFSGWGIRTLSGEHPAYNPFSYHRGSVWPVENGTFAFGFARYGRWDELHRLARGLFDATDLFVSNRLPEVLGGIPRDDLHPHPGIYPESHEPQAWSASMVIMVVQALLGMYPLAPAGVLLIDPHLPQWLPDLRLSGLRVGDARITLEFRRTSDGATRYRVEHEEGRVRVLRQPVADGSEATIPGRLTAAIRSAFPMPGWR
jgi:glycogen debranching enzyme